MQVRPGPLAIIALVVALTFSGCVGGDEGPKTAASEDAADAVATRETGSITGQVVTVDLEVLVAVEVGLMNRTGGIELTQTDKLGRYTFNDLRPGPYRIQMTDDCCKLRTVNVHVVAGNVSEVNLQAERLSSVDLRLPRVVSKEWTGFMACGVSVGGQSGEQCAAGDSNHEVRFDFNVSEGLQEMIIAMDWDPSGPVGEDMRLEMFSRMDCSRCNTRYFIQASPPPLIVRVVDDETVREPARFDQINGTTEMQYRAGPGGVSVRYQQEFTIYWHEFYNQGAPPGFEPLPDG